MLAAACLSVGCLARPDEKQIELSYLEIATECEGCVGFETTFRSGGHVEFKGRRGCALPGTHHYTIPEADWRSLVERFRSSDFFGIPRLGPLTFDAVAFRLTYRDARRMHEVIDTDRGDKRLHALERAMRTAARVEPWITPNPDLYRKALSERWDVNTRNEDGWNALTCAVSHKREDALRVLLDAGATVSPYDFTAAAERNDARMFTLLDRAAPLDVHSPLASNLLVATAHRKPDVLRYLIGRGVPIDARDSEGNSALLNISNDAAGLETLRFLLASGANPNSKDREGRSPLHRAALANDSGFITLLARAGAVVDAADNQGVTPLMMAVWQCQYWNIEPLVAAGADPTRVSAVKRRFGADPTWNNCRVTQEVLTRTIASSRTGHVSSSRR